MMLAGGMSGALAGCSSEDLYNPEAVREKAEQAFGMEVDPEQDWNMLNVVSANITIQEDALTDYTFRIYTNNPLSEKTTATLLAEQKISTDNKGKASVGLTFDLPSYLNYVYVARVDSKGRRLVKVAKISNDAINVDFGTAKASQTRAAITSGELPTMECPYTTDEVNELIANAYELTDYIWYPNPWNPAADDLSSNNINDLGLVNKTSIVIKGDYNTRFYIQNETTTTYQIIVTGTYKLADTTIPQNVDLIIAEGGTLDLTDCQLNMGMNSRLIVMPGATVIDNNTSENEWTPHINNNDATSYIYNGGTMNIKWFLQNSGSFYNAHDAIFTAEAISLQNENSVITNWGKMEVNKIVGNGSQGTINNGCLLRVKEEINVLYLNQAANTALECEKIKVCEVTLRENCILRTSLLNDPSNTGGHYNDIKYVGDANGAALISAKHIGYVNVGGDCFKISGRIYFEADTYEQPAFETTIMEATTANGYALTKVGEAPIYIVPSYKGDDLSKAECVGNGNTPVEEVPEDIEPTIYTYAYEDMDKAGGDYDMNDVVLKCSIVQDGKITVSLAAAGAMKDLTVHFNNKQKGTDIALFGGKEIHEALGVAAGAVVNTGREVTAEVISETIEVGEGFSYKEHGNFYIKDKENKIHIPAFTNGFQKGDVPYAILVPVDWEYPQENVKVSTAYSKFETWAGDVTKNTDWYLQK